MRQLLTWRVVRSTISLIAAYLLVVQAILASVAVTQAAASGGDRGNSIFVICHGAGDETAAQDGAAGQSGHPADCCLICTLSVAAVSTVPDGVAVPVWFVDPAEASVIAADSAAPPPPAVRVRSGITRGPPLGV